MTAETQLDTLEARGLIRLAAYQPELEYLFRHWLVQDAAYGSLLRQERRELHGRVGDALETLYPERLGELAAVLAMHFEQAGETDKAIRYLVSAGHYGLERNAIQEAFSAFDRAAALLPPGPAEEDVVQRRRRVEIELGRAQASWSFRSIDDVVADLDRILPEAEAIAEPEMLAPIHLLMALNLLMAGEPPSEPRAQRSLERIAELGEELGDPALRATPLALLGLRQVLTGPLRAGVEALEEAVPLLERGPSTIGAAFARGSLAIGYAQLGEFEKAEAAATYAADLAKKGDLISQLDAQIAGSIVRAARGDLDAAAPLAEDCVNRGEETGASACVMASSWILGDVYHRLGRFDDARKVLQRGADIALVVDRRLWRPTLVAWLGASAAALGEGTGGDWDASLETARSLGSTIGEAGILAKRGEARAGGGDVDVGLADLEAAAAIYEAEGARPALARVLQTAGAALRTAGRTGEAEPLLRRALGLFEEMGLDREANAVRLSLSMPGLELKG